MQGKNIAIWVNCYQDYFLREKVTRIETAESAQQVLDKVDIWLKIMDKYEDKYNIERLHPHYDAEIRDYEGKLNELITRLTRAKENNNFVEYSEIMEDGYKLLIELFESNTIKLFKDQVTLNYVNFKTNNVSQTPINFKYVTILIVFILIFILVLKWFSYIKYWPLI